MVLEQLNLRCPQRDPISDRALPIITSDRSPQTLWAGVASYLRNAHLEKGDKR